MATYIDGQQKILLYVFTLQSCKGTTLGGT
jgi:hypothetical protein